MSDFTPEKITELVKDHIRKVLNDDKACSSEQSAAVTPGSIIVNGETVLEPSSMANCNREQFLSTTRISELVQKYTSG